MTPRDQCDRPLRSLRLSVTDRCNLRCRYCMPEADYVWLPKEHVLNADDMVRLVQCFVATGVTRLRVTGGEPLLRTDLPDLVRRLSCVTGLEEISLTTNGVLLASCAQLLRAAGLHRITVSLDTLQAQRFAHVTGRDLHGRVMDGIRAAHDAGYGRGTLKINTVVMRGFNEDELIDLLMFGREMGAEIRFIEYMDVGGATAWHVDQVLSQAEILVRLEQAVGAPISRDTVAGIDRAAPARRYCVTAGPMAGIVFGIIASTTQPFCGDCDRARLTADGQWLTCLYAQRGVDLRALLRNGVSDREICAMIAAHWQNRTDRGAEERVAMREQRGPWVPLVTLKRHPHLEMHTRGG